MKNIIFFVCCFFIAGCVRSDNTADKITDCPEPPCLRKCCPVDLVWDFVQGTCRQPQKNYQFTVKGIETNRSIAVGNSCPAGASMIPQEKQPQDLIFASENGIIIDGRRLRSTEYCIDDVESDGKSGRVLFICGFPSGEEEGVEGFAQVEKVPLKKCCPGGSIYEISKGLCVSVNGRENLWPPVIFTSAGSVVEVIKAEDFHVTHEMNACPEGFIPHETADFRLLENGTAILQNSGSQLSPGDFCVDATRADGADKAYVLRSCVRDPCVNGTPCVKKCCPQGFFYHDSAERKGCFRSDEHFRPEFRSMENSNSSLELNKSDYNIRYSHMPSCSEPGFNLIDPSVYPDEVFFLLPDSGNLHVTLYAKINPEIAEYCVENFEINSTISLKAFICFPPSDENPELEVILTIYPIFLFISVFFLSITFVVYAILPELHNMHGLTTMCLVLCMIITYIGLGIIQTSGYTFSRGFCISTAIVVHFFFLAIFTWLSVMGFDIWFTFSRPDGQSVEFWLSTLIPARQREEFPRPLEETTPADPATVKHEINRDDSCDFSSSTEIYSPMNERQSNMRSRSSDGKKKRFIWYSLYAWSVPLVIVITGQLLDNIPEVPIQIAKPGFGITKCWFNDKLGLLYYFYGPIGVICIVNLVFFVLTAIKLYMTNKDTAFATHDVNRKERLRVIFYVFIVTGVLWIMEVISFVAEGSPYIWILPDIVNISSGVLIFYIFVCKPRVIQLLRKRVACFDSCCNSVLRWRNARSASRNRITLHSSEEAKRKSSTTICTQLTHDTNSVASADIPERRRWC